MNCPTVPYTPAPVEIGGEYCVIHKHRGRFNFRVFDCYRHADGWYALGRITRGAAAGGLTPRRTAGDITAVRLASCRLADPSEFRDDDAEGSASPAGDQTPAGTARDGAQTADRPGCHHRPGGSLSQRGAIGSAPGS